MIFFEQAFQFKLTDNFCDQYKTLKPDFGPIGLITYKRTYARTLPDGSSEDWWQTVKRVVEGIYTIQLNHCKHLRLPWNQLKAQASAREMYDRIFHMKFLPAGRSLYSMGTEVVSLRGSAALYNCAMVSTENINYNFSEPFVWLMDMSMCGVGVAFDTRGRNKIKLQTPTVTDETYTVDDSREGWCELVRVILDAYIGKEDLPRNVDYSKIRPAGSPLVTSGGIAPGPGPLITCERELRQVLDKNTGKQVSSTLIVDLMNIIGKAVVSGGKRRTAELALGDSNDGEYVSLKDPEKFSDEITKYRWASNNSIIAIGGMDYTTVAAQTAKNGEPGYIWLDNCRHYGRIKDGYGDFDLDVIGVNPCGEITLEDHELCNLVETYPSRHTDLEDFKKTMKYAYLYAKSVTLVPCHCERTNQVMMRNRRLGISQSGITEAINKLGLTIYLNWCDQGYAYIKHMDNIYSSWLCIPRSKKLTTVKPSGSISLLPGVTPGIHYPHSEYYIRRVKLDRNGPLYELMTKAGYQIVESVYEDNTWVAEIPVKANNFFRGKSDVSIWEQLELGAKIQYYWSDNSVSQTITYEESEARVIKHALDLYQDRLKGASFLANKHGYKQAPYEEITKEQYDEMASKLRPIKFKSKTTVHDNEEKGCDGDSCNIDARAEKTK